jgi:hypothetical protein
MSPFSLSFLSVFSLICLSASARADYTIPQSEMDQTTISNVVQAFEQVTSNGTFAGVTSSGQPCQVVVQADSGEIQIDNPQGGLFHLYLGTDASAGEGGDYLFYLLDYSMTAATSAAPAKLHLIISVNREEEPSYIASIDISGANGIPSSIQYAYVFGGQSGMPAYGNTDGPGQVYSSSLLTAQPYCTGFTKIK